MKLTALFVFISNLCLGMSNFTMFQDYVKQYNKTYSNISEFNNRYNIFSENINKINIINNSSQSYKLGITEYTDMTSDEFSQFYKGFELNYSINHDINVDFEFKVYKKLPKQWDWRNHKNIVTHVKDQGSCGSCWAFSAVEAIESAWAIKNNELLVLSEQEILDCDKSDDGCSGGEMINAFKYVEENGLCKESDYKYVEHDEECHKNCNSVVSIKNYVSVKPNSDYELMSAVVQQPVSVAIEANQDIFQLYKSGIIKNNCGNEIDHGVVVVGYGTENGVNYYIVRNSWGSSWGEDGYVRLERNSVINSGSGVCGILSQPSYPIV